MGTNATVVISNRYNDEEAKVLAGLYAQFDGGLWHVGAALLQALDHVVFVPGEFLKPEEDLPFDPVEILNWRAAYGKGIAVLLIARIFNAVDTIEPGQTFNMGDGVLRTSRDRRGSHNAFLLERPDEIDLNNSVYRYWIEPRTPEQPWTLAGVPVRFPRPWIKAMYGQTVIFEGWPEEALGAFEAWEAKHADD